MDLGINSPTHRNWLYKLYSCVIRWWSFHLNGHLLSAFVWQGCMLVDGSNVQMFVLEKFSIAGRGHVNSMIAFAAMT